MYSNGWKLALIKELHKGSDNMVRIMTIWTRNDPVKQHFNRLAALADFDGDD